MTRVRFILLLGLAAALQCASARAELARASADNAATRTAAPAHESAAAGHSYARALDEVSWLLTRAPHELASAIPVRAIPPSPQPRREPEAPPLPSGPNGFALGLSALTSLAAVQACRSLRKFNLSALPEWYHSGGPAQVGHATPYQLEHVPLAVCDFEQPSDLQPGISYRIPRELRSRLIPQFFLIVESPRGPPLPPSAVQ